MLNEKLTAEWVVAGAATVAAYDDLLKERSNAQEAAKALNGSIFALDYPAHISGWLESEELDGLVTDLMNGDQPTGLALALKARSKGIPCVIVTTGNLEGGARGHLPSFVVSCINSLPQIGVPVLIGEKDGGKRWTEAFSTLYEMIAQKWAQESSDRGNAVRCAMR